MTTNCIIKAAADQSMIHHIEHCSKRKNEDSAYCHARAITANGTIAIVIHRILCQNFIVLSHSAINVRLENHHVIYCSLSVKTSSRVIYHIPQAFTTANCRFSMIFCKGRGLWYFQFGTNFLRFFQGSSMVIFSVFDSNPRLLFLRILRSKV